MSRLYKTCLQKLTSRCVKASSLKECTFKEHKLYQSSTLDDYKERACMTMNERSVRIKEALQSCRQ